MIVCSRFQILRRIMVVYANIYQKSTTIITNKHASKSQGLKTQLSFQLITCEYCFPHSVQANWPVTLWDIACRFSVRSCMNSLSQSWHLNIPAPDAAGWLGLPPDGSMKHIIYKYWTTFEMTFRHVSALGTVNIACCNWQSKNSKSKFH